VLSHQSFTVCVGRFLIEKPTGSNSMETLLSRVSCRMEIRFLMSGGETRTLRRCKGDEAVGTKVLAVYVTGSLAPFPTMM
jgi:hypothetical protein